MKRTLTALTAFWFLAASLPAAAIQAQEKQEKQEKQEAKGPLSGAWKCLQHRPERPDREFQLVLEQRGEKITGEASSAQESAPVKGAFKDGAFKLAVGADQPIYELEGKLQGDKIGGGWTFTDQGPGSGAKGAWEGTRAEEPKGPLSGTWKCVRRGADLPENEFQLDLDQRGAKVTGMGSNAQGSAPLKGTFENGGFKLVVETGSGSYELEGKLEGDKISGTWNFTGTGAKGTWEGKKT